MSNAEVEPSPHARTYAVSIFARVDRPHAEYRLSWADLVKALTTFERTPCNPCPGKKCLFKTGSEAFSPSRFEGGRGVNDTVIDASLVVLDIDHLARAELDAFLGRVRAMGLAAIVYSSHSHELNGPDDCCVRLTLPLSRPATREEIPFLRAQIIQETGAQPDTSTSDLRRLYFEPSAPIGWAEPFAVELMGHVVDVDATLERARAQGTVAKAPPPHKAPRPVDPRPAKAPSPASPNVLAAARVSLKRLGPAIEGGGGDAHTVRAGAILLHDFALSEEEAFPLAEAWNATCVPPWEPEELYEKLRNGQRYAKGKFGATRCAVEELERLGMKVGLNAEAREKRSEKAKALPVLEAVTAEEFARVKSKVRRYARRCSDDVRDVVIEAVFHGRAPPAERREYWWGRIFAVIATCAPTWPVGAVMELVREAQYRELALDAERKAGA